MHNFTLSFSNIDSQIFAFQSFISDEDNIFIRGHSRSQFRVAIVISYIFVKKKLNFLLNFSSFI